jgi:hypothetical protein
MPPDVSSPCPRCGALHGLPGHCADGLGSGTFHQPTQPLADHLRWLESLGSKPCSCRFAWRSLSWMEPGPGRVRRSAGYGWVRENTDPRCPEHGRDVRDARTTAEGVSVSRGIAQHVPADWSRFTGPRPCYRAPIGVMIHGPGCACPEGQS